PDGWHGIGLLLLRVALGITLGIQGFGFFTHAESGPPEWVLGFIALIGAASFIFGVFTSTGGTIIIAGCLAAASSIFSFPAWSIFRPRLALVYLMAMAATLILTGPGAFSVDAQLFGRRQIVIP